jgi:hypothetical protein
MVFQRYLFADLMVEEKILKHGGTEVAEEMRKRTS